MAAETFRLQININRSLTDGAPKTLPSASCKPLCKKVTTEQAKHIIKSLTIKGIQFDSGLTDMEVLQVEKKFDISFPPDLKLFLKIALPVSDGFVNWRHGLISKDEETKINSRLDWPLEGMLFDLKSNNFWIQDWGDKPDNYKDKVLIAIKHYKTYPKLIPIYFHRYIPSRPNEVGNPVFSVYQMNIIYYGYDLATYFANEFSFELPNSFKIPEEPKLTIEFWSDWLG